MLKMAPTNQNYFPVYDSNAGLLGRITNAELRQKIAKAYSESKTLVDWVNYNEQRYQEWDRVRLGPYSHLGQQLAPDLINCADKAIRG
jgi:hypothetical protein